MAAKRFLDLFGVKPPMTDPPQESPERSIPAAAFERARLFIRAAQLRAQSWPLRDIAAELGLDSLSAARKCVEDGFKLAPGEDVQALRQRAAAELDLIRQQLWKIFPEGGTP